MAAVPFWIVERASEQAEAPPVSSRLFPLAPVSPRCAFSAHEPSRLSRKGLSTSSLAAAGCSAAIGRQFFILFLLYLVTTWATNQREEMRIRNLSAVTLDYFSCNISRNFVATQVARIVAKCNMP